MKLHNILLVGMIYCSLAFSTKLYSDIPSSQEQIYNENWSADILYEQLTNATADYRTALQHLNNKEALTHDLLIRQQRVNFALHSFTQLIHEVITNYAILDDDNSQEADRHALFRKLQERIKLIEEFCSSVNTAFAMLLIHNKDQLMTLNNYRAMQQTMTSVFEEEEQQLQNKCFQLIHHETIQQLHAPQWINTLIKDLKTYQKQSASWFYNTKVNHQELYQQAKQLPDTLYFSYKAFLNAWYNRHAYYDQYVSRRIAFLQELEKQSMRLTMHGTKQEQWLKNMVNQLINHIITLTQEDHQIADFHISDNVQHLVKKLAVTYSLFWANEHIDTLRDENNWEIIREFSSCMEIFFRQSSEGENSSLTYRLYRLQLQLEEMCLKYKRGILSGLIIGEHTSHKVFLTMLNIIEECTHLLQEKMHPQSSLISHLLSGAWLSTDKIHQALSGESGSIVMNVAKKVLSPEGHFSTLPAISIAAPPLAMGLIHYFIPSMSKKVQATVKQYFSHYAHTWKLDKLLQFLTDHPEVEEECRNADPELFSKIEEQVATITSEEDTLDTKQA